MNYLKIDKCDYLNGVGVGVVLWLSGCSHKCKGCQNPKSWDVNTGKFFDKKAEDELLRCLNQPYISRITFSGGDPLHENNLEDVLNIVNKIRLSFGYDKTIWLYSGYTWNEVWEQENKLRKEIVSKCDVFVDGRYKEELRNITQKWCGSTNQRVIDVQQSLKEHQVVLH